MFSSLRLILYIYVRIFMCLLNKIITFSTYHQLYSRFKGHIIPLTNVGVYCLNYVTFSPFRETEVFRNYGTVP